MDATYSATPQEPGLDPIEVPVVDVRALAGDDAEALAAAVRLIDNACRGPGFFYAVNHDINLFTLERVTGHFHRAIDEQEKHRIAIKAYNSASSRRRSGYYMAVPGAKANESFCYLSPSFDALHPKIADKVPLHEVNIWPRDAHGHGWTAYYESYYRQMFDLATLLLGGFALALGKPRTFFQDHFRLEDTLSAVSLIRYPHLDPYPPVKLGADGKRLSFEAHQDISLITILYQTPVPNLQSLTMTGYRDIPTSSDGFLVNCGTYMSYITNDHYRAPVHRVAFINRERLSIPFFVNLGYDDVIEPFFPPPSGSDGRAPAISYGTYLGKGLDDLIVSNGQT